MKPNRLLLPFLFILLTVAVKADDSMDKLYQVSTGWSYDSGRLELWVYDFSKVWFNGIRQHDDDNYLYHLKPGDELQGFICGDNSSVRRLRLDRLTPTRAWFTYWTYAVIITRTDEGGTKFARGRLLTTESFDVDLTKPNGLLIDYGPNYVYASGQKTVPNLKR